MAQQAQSTTPSRHFEPLAEGWRSFSWAGGSVDTAFRPHTRRVEGRTSLHHPTIFVLVGGGCRFLEVVSECGHRYAGPDFAGSVSFVPPAGTRHVRMTEVESEWASLSIRPDYFAAGDERDAPAAAGAVRAFTNRRDDFLHATLAELHRLHKSGEPLDALYCEAMAVAAAQYLSRRYGTARPAPASRGRALPGWRLRRVAEYVEARLDDPGLSLDAVARCVGLSTGFFHRAFRETTGETPLAYVQRRRMARAVQLLACRDLTVVEVAARVGFLSPGHFARLFRRHTGLTPSQYRSGRR